MGLDFFLKHLPGIRQRPLFRFSLMVIRANTGHASRRSSLTWSALKDEKIVALQSSLPECQNRELVTSRLINLVVYLDLCQNASRARKGT